LAGGRWQPSGWAAFFLWGLGYGLAVAGLLASTFHLGNPKNALKAFTQWRTSWLSREAWASVATLVMLAPVALSDWLGLGLPPVASGRSAGGLALVTVFTTAMIYTQIKAVPRWHHWLTPVMFLSLPWRAARAVGAGLGALALLAWGRCWWRSGGSGDGPLPRPARPWARQPGLTGWAALGLRPRAYRRQLPAARDDLSSGASTRQLRVIALAAGLGAARAGPAAAAWVWRHCAGGGAASDGALAARWLFFAEAEHVVGFTTASCWRIRCGSC
jgi:DMSO reductase anchor subunit